MWQPRGRSTFSSCFLDEETKQREAKQPGCFRGISELEGMFAIVRIDFQRCGGGGLCEGGTCWLVTRQRTEQRTQRDTVSSLRATIRSPQ